MDNKTKFLHHQAIINSPIGTKKFRGFTAAYRVEGERILLGIAICNSDDVFCRSRGRMIAEGRMTKKPHIVPLVGDSPAQCAREFALNLYQGGE